MLWKRRDIARTYISQVRDQVDPTVVPVFPPDTLLEVGDTVTVDDGRLVRRASVLPRVVTDVTEHPTGPQSFASAGSVSIGPSVQVPNPVGGDLLKATVRFAKAHAVVASFQAGVQRQVLDADAFGRALLQLWRDGDLNQLHAVVWGVRRCSGGTVLVAQSDGATVDVLADPALLGPAGLTLSGMSVGVELVADQASVWQLSTASVPLTASVRLLGLTADQRQVVDTFGFEDIGAELGEGALTAPASLTVEDWLSRV